MSIQISPFFADLYFQGALALGACQSYIPLSQNYGKTFTWITNAFGKIALLLSIGFTSIQLGVELFKTYGLFLSSSDKEWTLLQIGRTLSIVISIHLQLFSLFEGCHKQQYLSLLHIQKISLFFFANYFTTFAIRHPNSLTSPVARQQAITLNFFNEHREMLITRLAQDRLSLMPPVEKEDLIQRFKTYTKGSLLFTKNFFEWSRVLPATLIACWHREATLQTIIIFEREVRNYAL